MKILLATDSSTYSLTTIKILKNIPFPPGSEIVLTTVLEMSKSHFGAVQQGEATQKRQDAIRCKTEEALNRLSEDLKKSGWDVRVLIREGSAAEEIIKAAKELNTDLIVVGSRGLGVVSSFLLGSVSHKVIKYAPCSVLLVRENSCRHSPSVNESSQWEKLKILLAFDDSAISKETANVLQELPLEDDAEITIMTVLPIVTVFGMDLIERTSDLWQEDKRLAKEALQAVAEKMKQVHPNISAHLVESEETSMEILNRAKNLNTDLIILGSKGKNMMDRLLLGSVTVRIIEHAPCSVWIVRK